VVNRVTSDHIGALCFGMFNVSIAAQDLLDHGYRFEPESRRFVHETKADVMEGSALKFSFSK
jgi:hypothetical protein